MGVLETTYNSAMEKPLQVLEVFNDFFGEDRVDMQGFPTYSQVASALSEGSSVTQVKRWISQHCENDGYYGFILVHFPHITVTNEHNRSTEINHLYAKILVDIDGKIGGRFLLNRSEYSVLHISNGYMHSHVSNIPFGNFTAFQQPCTGTGPINSTICSLSRDFDVNIWRLFCLELSKYVEVESLEGVPYHRLEGLTAGGRSSLVRIADTLQPREYLDSRDIRTQILSKADIARFTKYLIDKDILKFSFMSNEYRLAMSPTDCTIRVSNAFIEWYNKEFKAGRVSAPLADLMNYSVLQACKFKDGYLVKSVNSRSGRDYAAYIGRRVCTFKGNPVTITIPDLVTLPTDENDVLILRTTIIEYIITKILNVINFRYGNKRSHEEGPSRKTVYFL